SSSARSTYAATAGWSRQQPRIKQQRLDPDALGAAMRSAVLSPRYVPHNLGASPLSFGSLSAPATAVVPIEFGEDDGGGGDGSNMEGSGRVAGVVESSGASSDEGTTGACGSSAGPASGSQLRLRRSHHSGIDSGGDHDGGDGGGGGGRNEAFDADESAATAAAVAATAQIARGAVGITMVEGA
ncbi:unnamed protein product, partial [Phaeothamnion confervicola]